MSKDTSSKRSLGDIILEKIREKDAEISTGDRRYAIAVSSLILGTLVV
jgi:essential nuclear protein 1